MPIKSFIIYSTPTCHYCHLLQEWLTANGVAFENKDVAVDIEARKEMVQKSQQMAVPVSVIKLANGTEQVVVGFDQLHLSRLLGI